MNLSPITYFMIYVVIILVATFVYARYTDSANASYIWKKLLKQVDKNPVNFEVSMLDDVPKLVKKFFIYMIKPGTPLKYVSVFKMHGVFSMGNVKKQKNIKVKCKQVLAPLDGFVWRVKSTSGLMRFSGSDGLIESHCWSRMWLMGLWPLSQKNLQDNMTKSSFGRMTAESTIWALASLLPQKNVEWEVIDRKTIRVIVTTQLMKQHVDITVTSSGKPIEIVFPRWSNANPQKKFQFQPFGAKLSSFKEVQGFMIPLKIEAGNHYGTKDYFPFYNMIIDSFEFR